MADRDSAALQKWMRAVGASSVAAEGPRTATSIYCGAVHACREGKRLICLTLRVRRRNGVYLLYLRV